MILKEKNTSKMLDCNPLFAGKLSVLTVLITLSIALSSCGKTEGDEARSLEQIYSEDGIPVRVLEISNTSLHSEMSFLATMLGIQETTINSKIGDKIVSIPVRVGSRVSEGQVLVTFPKNNPQLQWEQAKTALENAKRTYERMKNLLASGDIAQANFDGAETQYLVAKQNFESLKQMVDLDAPFSGVVTNVIAKVGDKVNPGDKILTIAQTGTMIARIWASESEVRNLQVGMSANIIVDGEELTGKIATISLSMDQSRKAFQVDVHFNNSQGKIKSGITTDLVFKSDVATESIVIPRRFIRFNGDEQYVFVANNDIARKVLIKTGQVSGVNITIVDGLHPNDKVITEGASLLDEGKKIRIIQ
jgi:RND family efflux transporter MFP subunit